MSVVDWPVEDVLEALREATTGLREIAAGRDRTPTRPIRVGLTESQERIASLRVLVVGEDIPQLRPAETTCVRSVVEALVTLARRPDDFDAVVIDERTEGRAVLEEAKLAPVVEAWPRTSIRARVHLARAEWHLGRIE